MSTPWRDPEQARLREIAESDRPLTPAERSLSN
jgi:hypothetical protein